MKKLLCAVIFVLSFCNALFAQNNQSASCPKLSVSGPSAIPQPREMISFTVNIDGTDFKNVIYNWTVSTGEIIEGQGTYSIRVKLPRDVSFTATVEVQGLPQNCPNTASEYVGGDPPPTAERIDEFSLSETRIDKARIDYFISKLQQDPNAQAYIIEKFRKNTSQQTIDRKIRKFRNYLINFRRQDKNLFTIIIGSADKNLTQFWIVPAGATPPSLNN